MVWRIVWIRDENGLRKLYQTSAKVRSTLGHEDRSVSQQWRRQVKRNSKAEKHARIATHRHKRQVREDQRCWKNYRHRQYRLTSNGVQIINGA